ncbi:6-phosphofructo-2-kinase NDAI_0G03840 [Naumovozyma dairenensis CBS 421]|uniref:6-phosphofructo-2-kinase domain-containing protein n=1 Tax=Naumovozyma dairenensis (strain ATCC 10597 / BCRC 20456 / CBS 421 / NBRC 0211 / NRRL Y-12639) TaxID=1071378 RepID=G0WEF0_NAUDC|nr:hypothetical protein NDAI_0G03840 [Naumovozyma dairenensis CBS 421]CCD26161.2 hypothetical protein NDAI_0G03840 [Naumovozyma dairenensis CBS 421]
MDHIINNNNNTTPNNETTSNAITSTVPTNVFSTVDSNTSKTAKSKQSSNSLFSLEGYNNSSYSKLDYLMNNSSYYYDNDEIEKDPCFLPKVNNTLHFETKDIQKPSPLSHLTFNYPQKMETITPTNSYIVDNTTNITADIHNNNNNSNTLTHQIHVPNKFVIIMIGLPAVGKSAISKQLVEYISQNFTSSDDRVPLRIEIFNAGDMRRAMSKKRFNTVMNLPNNSTDDIFNPKNSNKKEEFAKLTLNKLINELNNDFCDIGIFDATNSTVLRRNFIFETLFEFNNQQTSNFNLIPIVLQVTSSNPNFIKFNIHNKSFNEDYFDKPYHLAVKDFASRLKHYYSQFVPFSTDEFNHIIEKTPDCNLFYFNIIDAGLKLIPEKDHYNYLSKVPTNSNSQRIHFLINLISSFVQNYNQLYGHLYVEKVDNFFQNEQEIQQPIEFPQHFIQPARVDNINWDNSKKLNYLSVLSEVVNHDYLKDLFGNK